MTFWAREKECLVGIDSFRESSLIKSARFGDRKKNNCCLLAKKGIKILTTQYNLARGVTSFFVVVVLVLRQSLSLKNGELTLLLEVSWNTTKRICFHLITQGQV